MPRYSDDDLGLHIEIRDNLPEGVLEQWAAQIEISRGDRVVSNAEYRGSMLRAAVKAKLIVSISENGVQPRQLNVPSMPGQRVQWYGAALDKEYRKYIDVDPKVSGQ